MTAEMLDVLGLVMEKLQILLSLRQLLEKTKNTTSEGKTSFFLMNKMYEDRFRQSIYGRRRCSHMPY